MLIKENYIKKQGTYSDREIIELLNKKLNKKFSSLKKEMTISMFKHMGKQLQTLLKDKKLNNEEIDSVIYGVFKNPPPIVEELKEEIVLKEKAPKDVSFVVSFDSKGKEVLSFSQKGMKTLYLENNDLFEKIGKDEMTDHENDGRIFKVRTVKRKSDGKMFYYSYIWHSKWPTDFFENVLHEE